ncbi:MAG: ParB/RepB/Spo0J family partition protein [Macromonas sp.]
MSKVTDAQLAAGLGMRKKSENIAADLRSTIAGQMAADALRLPLDKIQRSAWQVRAIDDLVIEEMMASIQDTNGLITPVVVRPVDNGMYELIAGHTRYEACRRLGHLDIMAVQRNMNDEDAAKALVADNLARKDLSDYEISKQLKALFDANILKTNAEAARLMAKTRQDVIRYRSFHSLPEKVLEILENNPKMLGAFTAQSLSGFPAEHVIEGCNLYAIGKFKTQQMLIQWVKAKSADKRDAKQPEKVILDEAGSPIGSLSCKGTTLKVIAKGLDMEALESAVRREIRRQGFGA